MKKNIQNFKEFNISEKKKLNRLLSNAEFDKLIDNLFKLGAVSCEDLQKFKEYSIEFENENDEYKKKSILDTFSLDLYMDYEQLRDDVEDDINDLYFETGLDPALF